MQAINYPTVPRGEEKLRIAPTPHHTTAMMDRFVNDLCAVWLDVGLELKPAASNACPTYGVCSYCRRPDVFQAMEARVRAADCGVPNCPRMVSAAA